jgi:hypothetical protein
MMARNDGQDSIGFAFPAGGGHDQTETFTNPIQAGLLE